MFKRSYSSWNVQKLEVQKGVNGLTRESFRRALNFLLEHGLRAAHKVARVAERPRVFLLQTRASLLLGPPF